MAKMHTWHIWGTFNGAPVDVTIDATTEGQAIRTFLGEANMRKPIEQLVRETGLQVTVSRVC